MEQIFQKIEEQYGGRFRAATDEEMTALVAAGAPQSLIDHFAKFTPEETIEGQVVIADIDRVIAENTRAVPGCSTSHYGVYVIASTFCGDAYCLDTNYLSTGGNPRVVFVSHEGIGEAASQDEVMDAVWHVADDFEAFLVLFVSESIPEHF